MILSNSLALTIFTPAYNRASLLSRLFESISSQCPPGSSIEWLVIDDGSIDDTPTVLASFEKARPDLVRTLRVKNGGKHRALNISTNICRGKWIAIIDSDDYLLQGGLNTIFHAIEHSENEDIGMIAALLRLKNSKTSNFKVKLNPCPYTDWIAEDTQRDFCPIIRTDVAKTAPYPEIEGENYMAESWRYHRISRTHKTYFVNSEVVAAEYLPDGLSAKSLRLRLNSPESAALTHLEHLGSNLPPKLRWRATINFWRFYLHTLRRKGKFRIGSTPSRFWIILGAVFFVNDVLKEALHARQR